MASVEEVRAFMQNCSNLASQSEVARGLDAARNMATAISELTESFDRSLWTRGLSDEHKADIKQSLKRRLLDDVFSYGQLPVELPIITEVSSSNGWGLVHVKATVRTRIVTQHD